MIPSAKLAQIVEAFEDASDERSSFFVVIVQVDDDEREKYVVYDRSLN